MRSILAATILAVSAIAAQAAPQIAAQLQPDRVAVGESARLVVTLSGTSSNVRPDVPQVEGLRIQPSGQSSQIRIVNGQTSSTTGFTFRVTPEHAGEFEIPPIKAQNLETEPLELHVGAGGKQAAPQQPATPGQGGTSNNNGATTGAGTDGLAFLKVERADNGDRAHLYVGELTPIAIRAFFREGVQISQLSKPVLEGGAFTLHQLSDEPQQQSAAIDGQRYRVLTWFAGLSGVKAGEEKLAASLQATLGLPQQRQPQARRRQSPFGGSLFDDPFFDSVFDDFFQRVEHREVTLASEPTALEIRTLPPQGRPASFDGAVGQFKLGHFSIPAELKTGDPAELQISVNGEGNFDRVTVPQLLPQEKWKTYTAKDRTEAGDSIGYKGSKTFTLPAIALEPGEFQAGFSFDFFDPESGTYQTITTDSMPIVVSGQAVSADEPDASNSVVVDAAREGDGLAPLRRDPGRILATQAPPYTRAWFVALQAIPASALIAAAVIGMIRRRNDAPATARRRATQKAIDSQLDGLAAARQRQDGAEFFACARRALQHKLAERWSCNPEAITSEELSQRLPDAAAVARVFSMADAIEFSGMRPHPDSFGEWQARVEAALKEIEAPAESTSSRLKPSWGEVPQIT